jgi:DNA-binding transcriptional LysR family regulator
VGLRNMRVWRYIDEVARAGSVRQAAERLYVTPSALLRRIQDVEADLGTPIFERSAAGMQLTSAGEIFINWIRNQNADLRRVYSEIEALSGLRRGEIRISPSQAVARGFLLREIVSFRSRHPMVNFKVTVSDHGKAMRALLTYDTDLILVFRPPQAAELQPLISIGQGLVAVMAHDHPLAHSTTLRLRDCLSYDVALPDTSFSGREIIDEVLARSGMRLKPVMEVNSFELLVDLVKDTQIITFQIDIGTLHWRNDPKLAIVPIDAADAAHGPLVLGQLKGRMLPLAVAKFAEQLSRSLDDLRTLPTMQGPADSEENAEAA